MSAALDMSPDAAVSIEEADWSELSEGSPFQEVNYYEPEVDLNEPLESQTMSWLIDDCPYFTPPPLENTAYWKTEARHFVEFRRDGLLERAGFLPDLNLLENLVDLTLKRFQKTGTAADAALWLEKCYVSNGALYTCQFPDNVDVLRTLMFRIAHLCLIAHDRWKKDTLNGTVENPRRASGSRRGSSDSQGPSEFPPAKLSTFSLRRLRSTAQAFFFFEKQLRNVGVADFENFRQLFVDCVLADDSLPATYKIATLADCSRSWDYSSPQARFMLAVDRNKDIEQFLKVHVESTFQKERREKFEATVIGVVKKAIGVTCERYGSSVTGLRDRESDIDFGVDLKQCRANKKMSDSVRKNFGSSTASTYTSFLYERLRKQAIFKSGQLQAEVVPSARKPLVRIYEAPSVVTSLAALQSNEQEGAAEAEKNPFDDEIFSAQDYQAFSADVVISAELHGVRNSRLIAQYVRLDPRVKPVCTFVKNWSRQRFINGSFYSFLSSFAYTLSVITFLQTIDPPVLPNLQLPRTSLRNSSQPSIQDKFNDSFLIADPGESYIAELADPTVNVSLFDWKSENTQTVYELLRSYFSYGIIFRQLFSNV